MDLTSKFHVKRGGSSLSREQESIADVSKAASVAAWWHGPPLALTRTHKAHVPRHMGGIRGRRGRKEDRIYYRVRRLVCLNATLTAHTHTHIERPAVFPALFITPGPSSFVNRLPHGRSSSYRRQSRGVLRVGCPYFKGTSEFLASTTRLSVFDSR